MNKEVKPPLLKRLMDNPEDQEDPGVVVPMLSYTLWGWIELCFVPAAQLP